MARRGRFGRRPRTSPDLTATIVAMAREFQSTRDANIVNSWEKGGKFEGTQVTDDVLLKHLKRRRDGISKDDPLYDQMDQRLTEYTFTVANSKQELAYAQHKVTDAGMSDFYNKWAAKLPQDSEAWRNMMKLAAQYKDRAAKGSGGGGGGGRKKGGGGGYNSKANMLPQKKEVAYDTMLDLLTYVAHKEGILNTEKETLSDLRVAEGDASRLVEVLNRLNTDPKYAPERAQAVAYIKRWGNPNFSGQFTWEAFQAESVNKDTGIGSRLRVAQSGGHKTDAKALTKEMTTKGDIFVAITAAKPLARYEQARKYYHLAIDDANATPLELYMAEQAYRTSLVGILQTVSTDRTIGSSAEGANVAGHINNEILNLQGEGDVNAPTLWEDSRGVVAGYHQEGGEGLSESKAHKILVQQVGLLVSGRGVNVRVDSKGQPTNDPDAVYGVVPLEAIGSGVAWAPTAGHLPHSIDFEGRTADLSGVMTAVMPTPIFATAVGPNDITGRPMGSNAVPKANQNIANFFTMPDGTELAQYWDTAGHVRWTNDPDSLFGSNEIVDTPQGKTVRLTVPDPKYGAVPKYDPFDVIDPVFRDPAQADMMVNKVGRSSYTVWINSVRTSTSDPGIAFAMDPRVTAIAIARELGTGDPVELAAAIREGEEARTDYLVKTPDIDRRIRAAAKGNSPGSLADQLAQQGYGDVGGLTREVADFYDRLKKRSDFNRSAGITSWDLNSGRTSGYMGVEESERDAKIRTALMEDPQEAMRIAQIESGASAIPPHIADLMHQQQTRAVVGQQTTGPGPTTPAGAVAQFRALATGALGSAVGNTLTTAIGQFEYARGATLPTASGIPFAPMALPVPIASRIITAQTPPPVKQMTEQDKKDARAQVANDPYNRPAFQPITISRPGLSGTHIGGGGAQKY
jgi:hypothetical protein